jgi:hypothetical protein
MPFPAPAGPSSPPTHTDSVGRIDADWLEGHTWGGWVLRSIGHGVGWSGWACAAVRWSHIGWSGGLGDVSVAYHLR